MKKGWPGKEPKPGQPQGGPRPACKGRGQAELSLAEGNEEGPVEVIDDTLRPA
jgi:hypothetical protein